MKKRRFSVTFILLISITFFCFCNITQAKAQCKMMLISDSYSGDYLDANDNSTKIMGCDFYEPLSPLEYAGGVLKWYYPDSQAGPLHAYEFPAGNWRYENQGRLYPKLYAGADYVIYAIAKNDVGLMLNCGNDFTKGYPDNDTLIDDHDNFIEEVLIDELGYEREQIVLFFTGPVSYDKAGDPSGTDWEDCRDADVTDDECVNDMFSDEPDHVGWRCDYANRHLKLITRDFQNLATLRGMPFADMFTWVMNNYNYPDDFFTEYDEGDGYHVEISRYDYEWWKIAVSIIEEAILDIDGDKVLNVSDDCGFTPIGEIVDLSNGCSLEQLVPCEGPKDTTELWANHGKYMIAIGSVLKSFLKQGLITREEKDALQEEMSLSDCGK